MVLVIAVMLTTLTVIGALLVALAFAPETAHADLRTLAPSPEHNRRT